VRLSVRNKASGFAQRNPFFLPVQTILTMGMRTKRHNLIPAPENSDRLLLSGSPFQGNSGLKSVVAVHARYENNGEGTKITLSSIHVPAARDCFGKNKAHFSHEPDGTAPATPAASVPWRTKCLLSRRWRAVVGPPLPCWWPGPLE
jgi:hypothetical protein